MRQNAKVRRTTPVLFGALLLLLFLPLFPSAASAEPPPLETGARAYGDALKRVEAWDRLLRSRPPDIISAINSFRSRYGIPVELYPNSEAGAAVNERFSRIELGMRPCGTEYVIFLKTLSEMEAALEFAEPDMVYEVDGDGEVTSEWLVPVNKEVAGIRGDRLLVGTVFRTYTFRGSPDTFDEPLIDATIEVSTGGSMKVSPPLKGAPEPLPVECPPPTSLPTLPTGGADS